MPKRSRPVPYCEQIGEPAKRATPPRLELAAEFEEASAFRHPSLADDVSPPPPPIRPAPYDDDALDALDVPFDLDGLLESPGYNPESPTYTPPGLEFY